MVLNTELQASTGVSQIDAVLRGLLGIYQTVFPGRLRCLYVLGSHSNGSAVAGSDLDFGVVFAEPLAEEQLQQFRQISQSISLISPVRLDWGIVNPKRFTNGIPAGLRSALVVYGENVFNDLPLEPVELVLRRWMSNAFHSLYILRQRDDTLFYPLHYPDPNSEFYGYERWGTYLGERNFGPGVRSLTTSVTLMAFVCVMLQAGKQVASKQDSIHAYQTYVGDEWTEFVQQVYAQCRETWQYRVPKSAQARREFRRLCTRMLDFENHFLEHCRKSVLNDLMSSERAMQEIALYRLRRIAYPGEDYAAAVRLIQTNADPELARIAEIVSLKWK